MGYIKVLYVYILIGIYIKIKKRCIFVGCVEYLTFHFWKPQVLCWTVWIYESCGCPESQDLLCWSELAQVTAAWISLWERCFLLWLLLGQNTKEISYADKLQLVVVVVTTFSCSRVICGLSDTAVRPFPGLSWSSRLKEADSENFWKRILQPQPQGFYYSAFVQTRHGKHMCLYYIKIAW